MTDRLDDAIGALSWFVDKYTAGATIEAGPIRAGADVHTVTDVLTWLASYADQNPETSLACSLCLAEPTEPADEQERAERAVLTIEHGALMCQAHLGLGTSAMSQRVRKWADGIAAKREAWEAEDRDYRQQWRCRNGHEPFVPCTTRADAAAGRSRSKCRRCGTQKVEEATP